MHNWIDTSWTEDVQSIWRELLDSAPGLLCLDFDNTFVRGDFGEAVMEKLLSSGYPKNSKQSLNYPSLFRDAATAENSHKQAIQTGDGQAWKDLVWAEYAYVRKTRGLGESYRWSAFIFMGWEEIQFKKYCREIWLDGLDLAKNDKTAVHPREPLLQLVKEFQRRTWRILIVTASPQWAIAVTTSELGLAPDDVIGMRTELNSESQSTYTIIEPYPYGEGKVQAIHNLTGLTPDISFGDTINDFPMLKASKRFALLFDRGDNSLNQKCQENGIFIHPWI
ncbi:HAD family hydrolase [Leptospira sp. GIMC2001]|uniref:HAD family hydrolase n=1 Tax=Leptospira sp. GIMC2001 TaxID=1513297 RepID=UPI00234B6C62|nr:haloacid dehalogenase-like hydrolase [Leptospira sp. GIMC2001]WCL48491.1 haloacid dehalogenase-like hydrolase [Leptospira sp. GIMC2001]